MKLIKSTMTVRRQIVDLIPAHLVPKLARKHRIANGKYSGRLSQAAPECQ